MPSPLHPWRFPRWWDSKWTRNARRNMVTTWTDRSLKEGDNLERSLYFACCGCYPRLSEEGGDLIKKVLLMKRLPWPWAQLSTDNVNFCMRSRPYQHEAYQPSGPGRVFLSFFESAYHPSFTGQSYNRIMSVYVLQHTVVPVERMERAFAGRGGIAFILQVGQPPCRTSSCRTTSRRRTTSCITTSHRTTSRRRIDTYAEHLVRMSV